MLTFHQLKITSLRRCNTSYKHCIEDWTPTDWACAAAGELGEMCNLIKKLRRGDFDQDPDLAKDLIGDEIADTVIYLDLLCTRLGISLEQAIVRKFNKTSDKIGSDFRLSPTLKNVPQGEN